MGSFKNEGNHTVITEGETEVDSNHSGEALNDKETIGINLATSALIRSDRDIFNNARPKIRSAIIARKGDTTPDSANLQTLMQSERNKIRIKLYKTRT